MNQDIYQPVSPVLAAVVRERDVAAPHHLADHVSAGLPCQHNKNSHELHVGFICLTQSERVDSVIDTFVLNGMQGMVASEVIGTGRRVS